MPTLLVEIGCEEIPARFLESFMDEWSKALFSQFTQNNLHINKKDMTSFSTFRRLDRKSTRLNSSHSQQSRMPSSA